MNDLFLTNYTDITFLDKIKDSLKKCVSFCFTVSFIKMRGLQLLARDIEEALDRGVSGKIITSTYQNFTDIASLKYLLKLTTTYTNFSCHIDYNCFLDNGYHTKGYLFSYKDSYEAVIGSSNITYFALLKNMEWNLALSSRSALESIDNAYKEFDLLWDKTKVLDNDIIKNYSYQLEYAIEKWDMDYFDLNNITIKPNLMQRKALRELRRNRDLGVKKCLIIASTGSGKTYLSAFDAKNFDSKRLLYVVHRETILVDAVKSFENVFGSARTCGLYTGTKQEIDKDFVFATSQMISKHLSLFDKDEFDYICFDECHHATTDSYKAIMDYFEPAFVLGLTATPERMDNQDVYSLFENNVPFELRLRDAITNDLVVPFHYYAIKDNYIDYSSSEKRVISNEICKSINISFIKDEIEKHKKTDEKLKCIAFCTSIEHANRMANLFAEEGYTSLSLTGKDNTGDRIKAFKDLQDEDNPLEIITTVDILNEGVDIPKVNMVLFLRPTESSTIFLQQLGRGLRKCDGKEYLTVLDFIGNNYDRSVQIAIALGTLSKTVYLEKEYLKSLVRSDFKDLKIKGVEIFFDDLSKTEVLDKLDSINFNRTNFLKSDYLNFKSYLKLETYPSHVAYLDSDVAPNLIRFMKSSIKGKNKSYYSFLKKIGEENLPIFNDKEICLIDNISELLPLVRLDEYLIINQLLDNNLNLQLLENIPYKVDMHTLNHAYNVLIKKNIIKDDKLNVDRLSIELKDYLIDLLTYGMKRYDIEFGIYDTKFKLMNNYYKEQVQMILLRQSLSFMQGTQYDTVNGETYIYVGLKKDVKDNLRLNYKDKFISSKIFEWESVTDTTLDNKEGKKILNTKVVHLFVRKIESEDGITLPFTYFGTGKFTNIRPSYTIDTDSTKHNTLLCDIVLDNEVEEEYFADFEIKGDTKK